MHYYVIGEYLRKVDYSVVKVKISFLGATSPPTFVIFYSDIVVFEIVGFVIVPQSFVNQFKGLFFIVFEVCRFWDFYFGLPSF